MYHEIERWDRRYFSLAMEVAGWSKDPSTKVGAVCVAPGKRQFVTGFNGFPINIADDERLNDKRMKNKLMVHAELNCIINADVLLRGWTIYATKTPCTSCAAAIINARLARLVCPNPEGSWEEDQLFGLSLLTEAGIEVSFL